MRELNFEPTAAVIPNYQCDISFLAGGGEMGARMRAHDWAGTPLGPPEQWPQSLRTAVRIMLTSPQPMFVWWGDALINIYNDAYIAVVGGRHPSALGMPAAEVWREIWDMVGPRAESAMRTNEGTYDESLLLLMERNGYPEETYYTFSHSPIPGADGRPAGIFCANTDDTQRIVGERQLALLRELAVGTADARSVTMASEMAMACLATNLRDLPFALIYLAEAGSERATLVGHSGVAADHPAAPEFLDLTPHSPPGLSPVDIWPAREALAANRPLLVGDLKATFAALPTGAWFREPNQAVVIPLSWPGQAGRRGALVVALSPFRAYDDKYARFLQLVAAQITSAVANAQAYEDERKRAEALAELDRAKTTFFSNVSHEFRTPLALMLGPLADILEQPSSGLLPQNRQDLLVVQRNGQRLLKLVNTLLDFSRLEAGRIKAHYEAVQFASYTADIASVFRSAMEKAGLELCVESGEFLEPVFLDVDMWEKIVLNLISNAFKFTHHGSIRVSTLAREGHAVLVVEDTGIGIPADELPKLFNRFHRVEGSHGRTHEGSGIGLALVHELVHLHGGTVSVSSTPGLGTRFTVEIPLGHAHLPAEQISNHRPLETSGSQNNFLVSEALRWLPTDESAGNIPEGLATEIGPVGGEGLAQVSQGRILLADDNADVRAYVSRILSGRYEVSAVANGAEALEAAHRAVPDLVLTDVMMPKLDGFGLLDALRQDAGTASVPVILLSARAGEEARLEGLQAGADDYLTKPFSARELLARVDGTLALSRIRQLAARERSHLAAIVESSEDAMISKDLNGTILSWNRGAERLFGYSAEEIVGCPIAKLIPPDRMHEEAEILTSVRRGERVAHYDTVRLAKDGTEREVSIAISPILDAANQIVGASKVARDISQRKRSESSLKEADRRKDEFLATLAHELRSPLAPLRNGLHILSIADTDSEIREKTRAMMERQLKGMTRLVDDLMDMSRISRGKVELRLERLDLASVLANATETSAPLLTASRHKLKVKLPEEPLILEADATRLSQVFANLLGNAGKYTPPEGLIEVTATQEPGLVRISFRDNGAGIPHSMLPRIFDMFTQGDHSLEKTHGGLGIGLHIVQRLVELHGGRVDAFSDGPGRGSEFVVTLPQIHAAKSPTGEAVAPQPPAQARQRRLLVADDNEDIALSMTLLLKMKGHEVRTAHDGNQAIAIAEEFRPDFILMDIGMPGTNGYDACRRIREFPWSKGTTICALTGWSQDEDRRRSQEAGFDHHLVKPVEPATLFRILAESAAVAAERP